MRRAVLAVVVAIGAAAPAEAVLAQGRPAASASAEAERFVRSLYARYDDDPASQVADWASPEIFAPALLALIRRDRELHPDEVPYIDADPICSCQDWENLRLTQVAIRPAGRDRADAPVAFTNSGAPWRLTLKLQRTPRGWRIADIVSAEDPQGLAATLRRANARAERENRRR